jgi:hypothetical protein
MTGCAGANLLSSRWAIVSVVSVSVKAVSAGLVAGQEMNQYDGEAQSLAEGLKGGRRDSA